MTKTVLFKNVLRAESLQDAHQRAKGLLQQIYDAYQELGLKKPMTSIDDLRIYNPEEFVREQLYQENATLKSLPLKKEHVLAMIELPTGFERWVASLNGLSFASRFLGDVQDRFLSLKNGKVELSSDFEEWVTQSTSVYASEEEAQALKDAQAILKQLEDFQQKYPSVRVLPAEAEHSPTLFYTIQGKVKMRGLSVRTTNH